MKPNLRHSGRFLRDKSFCNFVDVIGKLVVNIFGGTSRYIGEDRYLYLYLGLVLYLVH